MARARARSVEDERARRMVDEKSVKRTSSDKANGRTTIGHIGAFLPILTDRTMDPRRRRRQCQLLLLLLLLFIHLGVTSSESGCVRRCRQVCSAFSRRFFSYSSLEERRGSATRNELPKASGPLGRLNGQPDPSRAEPSRDKKSR